MSRLWSFAMVTVLSLAVSACTTPSVPIPDSPSTIILKKPVHFSSPDGADVLAAVGIFRVEQATDKSLRLVPREQKESILIQAQSTKYDEPLNDLLALSIPFQEDEHHVVLLKPDGTALDATGTYSGVKSRATGTIAPLSSSYVKEYRRARFGSIGSSTPPPPPTPNTNPDLVITSAALIPTFPTPYDLPVLQVTVMNQGLTDATLYALNADQLSSGMRHLVVNLFDSMGNPVRGWALEPANLPVTVASGASQVLNVPEVARLTDTVGTFRWDIELYSRITEANAANNTYRTTFTVQPRPPVINGPAPDLTLRACSFMPANPTQRDMIHIVTQYTNQGTVTATLPSTAPIFQWTSSPAIAGRSSFRMGPGASIAPGVVQPFQGQLNVTQAALPGTYQIAVVVDPDNRVGESDEKNNSVTCTLVVGP